jgi:hypothetical protein
MVKGIDKSRRKGGVLEIVCRGGTGSLPKWRRVLVSWENLVFSRPVQR